MKNKKLILFTIIFLIISFFINVIPNSYHKSFSNGTAILFLNFKSFTNFGLEKFNPQLIIMFLIFIYIVSIKLLSSENENNTFKSLYLVKFTRKTIIRKIAKNYIYLFTLLALNCFITITLLFYLVYGIIDFVDAFILFIYLIRLFTMIYFVCICYTLSCFFEIKNQRVPIIFIILISLIFLDLFIGCSTITYSNTLKIELSMFSLEFIASYSLYIFIKSRFLKKEDLFND